MNECSDAELAEFVTSRDVLLRKLSVGGTTAPPNLFVHVREFLSINCHSTYFVIKKHKVLYIILMLEFSAEP